MFDLMARLASLLAASSRRLASLARQKRGLTLALSLSLLTLLLVLNTPSSRNGRFTNLRIPGITHTITVTGPQKRAYATFLSTRVRSDTDDDPYFTATRVLNFQLQYAQETRSTRKIPFVVMVTENVAATKRRQLTAEGCTVLPVDHLLPTVNWTKPGETRFIDQFTKLRLWELTQFDQILYLDNDMLLTKSLDSIWDEPFAKQVRLPHATPPDGARHPAEGALPQNYSIVGVSDTQGANHPFPPHELPIMNGGFMLLRPSHAVFAYYVSLLNIPGLFNANLMEQSLLNYAHRRTGSMPWKAFPPGKWNVNWPRLTDLHGGAATLHDKFWEKGNKGWIDRELVEMWWRVRGQMEGFWMDKGLHVAEKGAVYAK